jgi:hypothetical protein
VTGGPAISPRELRARLAALPPERRELARELLAQQGFGDLLAAEADEDTRARARAAEAARRQRIWAEYLSSQEWGRWHTAVAVTVAGHADPAALRRDLERCLASREITAAPLPPGAAPPAAAGAVHAPPGPPARGDAEGHWTEQAAARPFLPGDPPVRVQVKAETGGRVTVLLCGHDLAVDRASLRLLAKEVLNGAPDRGAVPDETARDEIGYADLAARRLAAAEAESGTELLRRWARVLGDVVPTGPPRTAACMVGRRVRVGQFGRADMDEVRAFARENLMSPFAVLLAAWALVAGQYSGCVPPVIGCCLDGRADADAAAVIGPLANQVLIRVPAGEDGLSFAELARRAADAARAAYQDGSAAIERVLAEAAPRLPREVAAAVTIGMVDEAGDEFARDGQRARFRDVFCGFAKEALRLEVTDGPAEPGAVLEYQAAAYQPAEIADIGARLARVLRLGVTRPDQPAVLLARAAAGKRVPGATPTTSASTTSTGTVYTR